MSSGLLADGDREPPVLYSRGMKPTSSYLTITAAHCPVVSGVAVNWFPVPASNAHA
jgi:hypothetical protein